MLPNLAERIAWSLNYLKGKTGYTWAGFDKELSSNKDTIADYAKGKGLIKGEVLEKLASKFDLSSVWLFEGKGEPFPGAREKYPEVCGEPHSEGPKTRETNGLVIPFNNSHLGEGVDHFAQAVSALKDIFNFEDPKAKSAILSVIKIIQICIDHMHKQRDLELRMKTIEKVFEACVPPEGTEERREAWPEVKKALNG